MERIQRLRAAFAGAAVCWAAALPCAAAVAGAGPAGFLRTAATLVYAVGAVVCHQQPARSFHLLGVPWPVCARCTGIYVAAALVILATGMRRRRRLGRPAEGDAPLTTVHARSVAHEHVRWLAVSAVLPSALTLLWEWTLGVPPSNAVRAAAGAPIGAFVAWVMLRRDHDAGRALGRVGQSG